MTNLATPTLVDNDIPLNAGCRKPLQLIIPEGCMLNPTYPAAVVGGNVVYDSGEFGMDVAPLAPMQPDWSPVRSYGGYFRSGEGS